jgi:AraC-like DNA-binding protein
MLKEVVVLTPMYISLFWALVFFNNRYQENKARFWLGIFMLVTAVLYACHAVFFHDYRELYLKIDSIYLFTGLSVYPLYYIYIRLLTCDLNPKREYILHFLPAVGFSVALFLTGRFFTQEEKMLYYEMVLIKLLFPGTETSSVVKAAAAVFFMSRVVFAIQTFIYLLLGYRLVQRYNKRIANFYSNLEGRELLWVKLLIISFLFTSVVSFVVNLIGRGYFMNNYLLLTVPSLMFSFLLFLIGIQGNKQNFNFGTFNEDEQQEQKNERYANGVRNELLKQNLLELLDNKKIYLDAELKITELCRNLNTNRTYLSNVINNDFQLSFNDLINKYRVHHVISLIEKDIHNKSSFRELADASGFGSLSSFNRAFKKFTGTTAGEYINKQGRRTAFQMKSTI